MNEAEVFSTVSEIILAETGRGGPIAPETQLVDQLGLDSLALLSITVELENRFELCLEPEEDEPLLCVGDIVALLLRASATPEGSA